MRILIARGTLTKDEQYELGGLLLKAGYGVRIGKGTGKETKAMTIIEIDDQRPMAEEEDLS